MSTQMTERERYWADLMTEEEMDAYEADPANMKPEFLAGLDEALAQAERGEGRIVTREELQADIDRVRAQIAHERVVA